jgi:hypothetical protein
VPSRLARGPDTDLDGIPCQLDAQLRLAHELRNSLVDNDRWLDTAVKATWSSLPQIAEVEDRISALEKQILGDGGHASDVMIKTGTESIEGSIREQLHRARAQRRRLLSAAKPQVQPQLDKSLREARASARALYADYVQERGLYWATFNDVKEHHRLISRKVAEQRRNGRPAELRTRQWDGSGAIAVQLRRPAGDPARTPDKIADAERGRWRSYLTLPWVPPEDWDRLPRSAKRMAGRSLFRFRIARGVWLELPIVQHRMLPPDADIAGARLVVRRRGGHRKVELHVTARLPDPAALSAGAVVALNTGVHRQPNGATITATWRSTRPRHNLPSHLRGVIEMDTPYTGVVQLTGEMLRRAERHQDIHQRRMRALELVREHLVRWLTTRGPIYSSARANGALRAVDVQRWRSPSRFAALALQWRNDPVERGSDIALTLEQWRIRDRAMWEGEAHGRAGLRDARDDRYRRAVAWLLEDAQCVVLAEDSVGSLRPKYTEHDPTGSAASIADHAVADQMVAPGRLREFAVTAASIRGTKVLIVPRAAPTRIRHGCGALNSADDYQNDSGMTICAGCGEDYDFNGSITSALLSEACGLDCSDG